MTAADWCTVIIVCVACLPELHTLQISHNRLQSVTDIEHLVHCNSIGVLDLSHNQLDDPMILDVLKRMKSLVHLHMLINQLSDLYVILTVACSNIDHYSAILLKDHVTHCNTVCQFGCCLKLVNEKVKEV